VKVALRLDAARRGGLGRDPGGPTPPPPAPRRNVDEPLRRREGRRPPHLGPVGGLRPGNLSANAYGSERASRHTRAKMIH